MRSNDFILEGKSYRAWTRAGAGQVGAGQRVAMPRPYDAEQFVQKLQHNCPEHLADLCELAGVASGDGVALAEALHNGTVIIGLGIQSGGGAVADASAAQKWRAKQAAPAPIYGPAMQQFFAGMQTSDTLRETPSQPANTNLPTWECVIEIAGTGHANKQSLRQQSSLKQPVSIRTDRKQSHRSLASFPVPDSAPVAMAIVISSTTKKPFALPLPQSVQPRQTGPVPATELDTLIIPVRPVQFRNLRADPNHARMPQNGHLYLFWKGKLWRELAVDDKNNLRDVDVAWEREQRSFTGFGKIDPAAPVQARTAIGQALDSIWIPFKLNGNYQTGSNGFEMAFFPQPLRWDEIDTLESDAKQRSLYSTSLDGIRQYSASKDFSGFDGGTGGLEDAIPQRDSTDPEALLQNASSKALQPYRNRNYGAAYVKPTVKTLHITLQDAYLGNLPKHQWEEGESVTLKGRKEYAATISRGMIQCDVDIQETKLDLVFAATSHQNGSNDA